MNIKRNYKKPIDNICFWYDPVLGKQYTSKKDIPTPYMQRCEYWDSLLEFRLHEELLKIYPASQVIRQYTIQIMPKLEPFKAWTWCVDFKIDLPIPIYIEAKGKWLIEALKAEGFWKTLRVLQQVHPDIWSSLIFVGSNKDEEWYIPQSTIRVHPMHQLTNLLGINNGEQ